MAAWALGFAAGCSGPTAPHAIRELVPAQVFRVELSLQPQQSIEFVARELSAGARPVLHLFDLGARRSVARAASSVWRRAPRLAYRNPGPAARRYLLLLHAASAETQGHADLHRDGRLLQRRVPVEGPPLAVAGGPGYAYRLARAGGSRAAAVLYAFDRSGELLEIAEGGAEGRVRALPVLSAHEAIRQVIVARPADGAAAGALHLYANDPDDRDGDGLGRQLERALGICDAAEQPACAAGPLAAYYRAVEHATRDSDRDGLPDADELLGVPGPPPLDLPAWGADPRHKDVFVEVDHHRRLPSVGLDEADLERIAALYAAGSADALRNLDGLPGVRLHLDVGFEPRNAQNRTLFGDWGGSNRVPQRDYRKARRTHLGAGRERYFRYALAVRGGTGQARGDAFTWNRDYHRVALFAHELGHTLGLHHAGHPRWGRVNCKPHYRSVMNYVYQNRPEIGFARGARLELNAARVSEVDAFRGADTSALAAFPLELDVFGAAVDWNRDGLISAQPVRAALTWATDKSCGAAAFGRRALFEGAARAATPVLARTADGLLAFWLGEDGRLWLRRGERAPAGTRWSTPRALAALGALRHHAALALDDGSIALALVSEDAQLSVARLSDVAGEPRVVSRVDVPAARTAHAPALVAMEVDEGQYGARHVLSVVYRSGDAPVAPLVHASALDPAGPFVVRELLDGGDRPIVSALDPALSRLGSGELCAVFADAEAFLRFFCYDRPRDRFVDLSSRAFYVGLGPRSAGRPALAYHRYRLADGSPVDPGRARGAAIIAFSEWQSARAPASPFFLVSEWLDAEHGARERIAFRWRGRVIDQWTNLAPGTGIALHGDAATPSLEAVMAVQGADGGDVRVDYLPHADGAYDLPLSAGNDFEVMERGICARLRGDRACGGPDTGAY